MDYIDEIEYANSYDSDEADYIISVIEYDNEYRFRKARYEGTIVIKVLDADTGDFLGYYTG